MNIYLIRHGERQDGIDNLDSLGLSEKGIRQAELLGKRLTKHKINKIYSSNSVCAMQTSDILGKYLMLDFRTRYDLREIDMGAYQRGWEFLNEFYPNFAVKFSEHTEDIPYPGGENGRDVLLRASNVISEILDSRCDNVAVVTHDETISILLCGVLGLGQARRFFIGSPIENCSISIIKYDNKSGCFYLHSVNDHAHLEDSDAN